MSDSDIPPYDVERFNMNIFIHWRFNFLIALGIAGTMAMIPFPARILDNLLMAEGFLLLAVLLKLLFIKQSADYTYLPAVLLLVIFLSLVLSMSVCRNIIVDGHAGVAGAVTGIGRVVRGFKVVATLLLISMFVVCEFIACRTEIRCEEITGKFVLDSLPGHKMQIDADLAEGLITSEAACKRRRSLFRVMHFFGSTCLLARCNRYLVRGNIIITIISFCGGMISSMRGPGVILQESVADAAALSIGAGIVALLPTLLISYMVGTLSYRAVGTDFDKWDLSCIGPAAYLSILRTYVPGYLAGKRPLFSMAIGNPAYFRLNLAAGDVHAEPCEVLVIPAYTKWIDPLGEELRFIPSPNAPENAGVLYAERDGRYIFLLKTLGESYIAVDPRRLKRDLKSILAYAAQKGIKKLSCQCWAPVMAI